MPEHSEMILSHLFKSREGRRYVYVTKGESMVGKRVRRKMVVTAERDSEAPCCE